MQEFQKNPPIRKLALLVLVIVICSVIVNVLSAYIRHVEAGLDCQPWPQCYGVIGNHIESVDDREIAQRALAPTELIKKTHRTVATILVILVLLLIQRARQLPTNVASNYPPFVIAAILLLLAVVGPASYLKTLPAIALVNYMGGTVLVAVGWWYWLQLVGEKPLVRSHGLRVFGRIGLVLLFVQMALGAWISGNFAGLACSGVMECTTVDNQGDASFWYLRELHLDAAGRVIAEQAAVTIAMTHRVSGALLAFTLLAAIYLAVRQGDSCRRWGLVLLVLLILQISLGLAIASFSLPLILVLGHNTVAALLMLTLIKLNSLTQ